MAKLAKLNNSAIGNVKATSSIVGATNSFLTNCQKIIIQGYFLFKAEKLYQDTWVEETFSANMRKFMKIARDQLNYPFTIGREDPQDDDDILKGLKTPKSAKRMDIVFSTFTGSNELNYGVEAKVLTERNIGKRNAKSLNKEYILEGIDRYLKNNYSMQGCMVGYVLEGNCENIKNGINSALGDLNRPKEYLVNKHKIEKYEFCYHSDHTNLKLKHFLLDFTTLDL